MAPIDNSLDFLDEMLAELPDHPILFDAIDGVPWPPLTESIANDTADVTQLVNPGFTSNVLQEYPLRASSSASSPGYDASNHRLDIVNLRCLSNFEKQGCPPTPDSNIALSSVPNSAPTSSINTRGNAIEQNGGENFPVRFPPLGRRLLIQKYLTNTDMVMKARGILLPKGMARASFPHIEVDNGLEIEMHDGEEENRTWPMRLVIASFGSALEYRLKESFEYVRHHNLQENDLLQIVLEEPEARYVLKFKRYQSEYIPPPSFDHTHTGGRQWRLIFKKILTSDDACLRPQSIPSICITRKEVEANFPMIPPPNSSSIEVTFYDWYVERTWTMKLEIPRKKDRSYKLLDTADFLRSYTIQEGDLLVILKSDVPHVRYALKVDKALA